MPQSTVLAKPPVDLDIDLDIEASREQPFCEGVLDWVNTKLRPAGFPKPLCKRLAVIISGLVASDKATLGEITTAIHALAISKAKDESIARRLQRALDDARLSPSLLPLIFRPLLPELLRSQLLAHAANSGTMPFHHGRFTGVTIILDESSKEGQVHLLVAGLPVGGIVLPLAVRTWPQGVAMPEGEYWAQVMGLLQEIQDMLPPELRDHVLLTADRAYGVPRMLDVLTALGWDWLLRVQGQTVIRLRNGLCKPLRTLVPKPGTQWTSGFRSREATDEPGSGAVGVFKAAGWRGSKVVAVWAEGQDEPWLLLTSLPARPERLAEYAQRWAIERFFLSWKSHGWDIEASGIRDPQRLGRLLTAMVIATLWRLAMALPTVLSHLADLRARASGAVRQLPLPGFSAPPRPWAAKYGLLTWGAKVASTASLTTHTPALCWRLPDWKGRSWGEMCRDTYLAAHGQFFISP